MPTSRQLQIFVMTAETGSMRIAAERLDISQPSVTKQIKALERDLGGTLFERERGKKAELSEFGKKILRDAREGLQITERMRQASQSAIDEVPYTILVRSFMSKLIKDNHTRLLELGMPRDTRFMLVDDREDIFARVREMPRHMGLLRTFRQQRAIGLTFHVLQTETLSLYASPDLARRIAEGNIPPNEVRVFVADTFENELWGRNILDKIGLADACLVPGPPFHETTIENIVRGEGVGTIFDWHAKEMVAAGKIARVGDVSDVGHLLLIAQQQADRAHFAKFVQMFAAIC